MFNLSVLHVWFKTFGWNHPVCSICQYFMSGSKRSDGITLYVQTCQYFMCGSKLLDGITLYIQLVCSSCLVQNLDGITVYVQLVLFKIWMESPCMFKLSILHVWLKNFGWNHPVCSNCLFFMSGSKLLDGNTLYVQLVYLISGSTILDWITVCLICQYFMSGSKFWMEFLVSSTCQYFMSGSKLLDWTTLYVQFVST
jgi:hypothetical protein